MSAETTVLPYTDDELREIAYLDLFMSIDRVVTETHDPEYDDDEYKYLGVGYLMAGNPAGIDPQHINDLRDAWYYADLAGIIRKPKGHRVRGGGLAAYREIVDRARSHFDDDGPCRLTTVPAALRDRLRDAQT